MSASVLQLNCTMQCPHGGQVVVIPSQTRTRLGGLPALLPGDAAAVTGCPLVVASKPQPCVTVTWNGAATRARVDGQGPLLQTSVGLCKSADGVPQGIVIVSGVQTKVAAE
jgi:hypothetical protein